MSADMTPSKASGTFTAGALVTCEQVQVLFDQAMPQCSMQAFAALQHAYSILQRHNHNSLPAPMSQPEAEQAAGSQHNRLLLQAYEIPQSCWHLLPLHLQADSIPCNTPFLAFPLDAKTSQAPCGPSASASGGVDEVSEAVTAAGAAACVEGPVLPLQPMMSSNGCAKGIPSTPDAVAAAAAAGPAGSAGPAASNASACLNTPDEQREAGITGGGSSLVADVALQHTTTCCSAGTACSCVAKSIGNDSPTALAGFVPDAMNSAAASTLTAGKACEAGAAGNSRVDSTDTVAHQSMVSAVSSRQGQGQSPGQGQGPGQDWGLVQMALLVPCRKAMKDRFPLNGTFFQVNEVFLDHSSITLPLQVFPAVSHKTVKSRLPDHSLQ